MAPPGSFSFELEEALIDLVEERPSLWRVSDPQYYQKDIKHRKFAEIAAALGGVVTADVAKRKWNSLRSAFAREQRKVKDSCHQPRWVHYKRMTFLNSAAIVQSNSESNPESTTYQPSSPLALLPEAQREQSEADTYVLPDCSPRNGYPELETDSHPVSLSGPGLATGAPAANKEVRTPSPPGASPSAATKTKPKLTIALRNIDRDKIELFRSAVRSRNRERETAKDEVDTFLAYLGTQIRAIPAGLERDAMMSGLIRTVFSHKHPGGEFESRN